MIRQTSKRDAPGSLPGPERPPHGTIARWLAVVTGWILTASAHGQGVSPPDRPVVMLYGSQLAEIVPRDYRPVPIDQWFKRGGQPSARSVLRWEGTFEFDAADNLVLDLVIHPVGADRDRTPLQQATPGVNAEGESAGSDADGDIPSLQIISPKDSATADLRPINLGPVSPVPTAVDDRWRLMTVGPEWWLVPRGDGEDIESGSVRPVSARFVVPARAAPDDALEYEATLPAATVARLEHDDAIEEEPSGVTVQVVESRDEAGVRSTRTIQSGGAWWLPAGSELGRTIVLRRRDHAALPRHDEGWTRTAATTRVRVDDSVEWSCTTKVHAPGGFQASPEVPVYLLGRGGRVTTPDPSESNSKSTSDAETVSDWRVPLTGTGSVTFSGQCYWRPAGSISQTDRRDPGRSNYATGVAAAPAADLTAPAAMVRLPVLSDTVASLGLFDELQVSVDAQWRVIKFEPPTGWTATPVQYDDGAVILGAIGPPPPPNGPPPNRRLSANVNGAGSDARLDAACLWLSRRAPIRSHRRSVTLGFQASSSLPTVAGPAVEASIDLVLRADRPVIGPVRFDTQPGLAWRRVSVIRNGDEKPYTNIEAEDQPEDAAERWGVVSDADAAAEPASGVRTAVPRRGERLEVWLGESDWTFGGGPPDVRPFAPATTDVVRFGDESSPADVNQTGVTGTSGITPGSTIPSQMEAGADSPAYHCRLTLDAIVPLADDATPELWLVRHSSPPELPWSFRVSGTGDPASDSTTDDTRRPHPIASIASPAARMSEDQSGWLGETRSVIPAIRWQAVPEEASGELRWFKEVHGITGDSERTDAPAATRSDRPVVDAPGAADRPHTPPVGGDSVGEGWEIVCRGQRAVRTLTVESNGVSTRRHWRHVLRRSDPEGTNPFRRPTFRVLDSDLVIAPEELRYAKVADGRFSVRLDVAGRDGVDLRDYRWVAWHITQGGTASGGLPTGDGVDAQSLAAGLRLPGLSGVPTERCYGVLRTRFDPAAASPGLRISPGVDPDTYHLTYRSPATVTLEFSADVEPRSPEVVVRSVTTSMSIGDHPASDRIRITVDAVGEGPVLIDPPPGWTFVRKAGADDRWEISAPASETREAVRERSSGKPQQAVWWRRIGVPQPRINGSVLESVVRWDSDTNVVTYPAGGNEVRQSTSNMPVAVRVLTINRRVLLAFGFIAALGSFLVGVGSACRGPRASLPAWGLLAVIVATLAPSWFAAAAFGILPMALGHLAVLSANHRRPSKPSQRDVASTPSNPGQTSQPKLGVSASTLAWVSIAYFSSTSIGIAQNPSPPGDVYPPATYETVDAPIDSISGSTPTPERTSGPTSGPVATKSVGADYSSDPSPPIGTISDRRPVRPLRPVYLPVDVSGAIVGRHIYVPISDAEAIGSSLRRGPEGLGATGRDPAVELGTSRVTTEPSTFIPEPLAPPGSVSLSTVRAWIAVRSDDVATWFRFDADTANPSRLRRGHRLVFELDDRANFDLIASDWRLEPTSTPAPRVVVVADRNDPGPIDWLHRRSRSDGGAAAVVPPNPPRVVSATSDSISANVGNGESVGVDDAPEIEAFGWTIDPSLVGDVRLPGSVVDVDPREFVRRWVADGRDERFPVSVDRAVRASWPPRFVALRPAPLGMVAKVQTRVTVGVDDIRSTTRTELRSDGDPLRTATFAMPTGWTLLSLSIDGRPLPLPDPQTSNDRRTYTAGLVPANEPMSVETTFVREHPSPSAGSTTDAGLPSTKPFELETLEWTDATRRTDEVRVERGGQMVLRQVDGDEPDFIPEMTAADLRTGVIPVGVWTDVTLSGDATPNPRQSVRPSWTLRPSDRHLKHEQTEVQFSGRTWSFRSELSRTSDSDVVSSTAPPPTPTGASRPPPLGTSTIALAMHDGSIIDEVTRGGRPLLWCPDPLADDAIRIFIDGRSDEPVIIEGRLQPEDSAVGTTDAAEDFVRVPTIRDPSAPVGGRLVVPRQASDRILNWRGDGLATVAPTDSEPDTARPAGVADASDAQENRQPPGGRTFTFDIRDRDWQLRADRSAPARNDRSIQWWQTTLVPLRSGWLASDRIDLPQPTSLSSRADRWTFTVADGWRLRAVLLNEFPIESIAAPGGRRIVTLPAVQRPNRLEVFVERSEPTPPTDPQNARGGSADPWADPPVQWLNAVVDNRWFVRRSAGGETGDIAATDPDLRRAIVRMRLSFASMMLADMETDAAVSSAPPIGRIRKRRIDEVQRAIRSASLIANRPLASPSSPAERTVDDVVNQRIRTLSERLDAITSTLPPTADRRDADPVAPSPSQFAAVATAWSDVVPTEADRRPAGRGVPFIATLLQLTIGIACVAVLGWVGGERLAFFGPLQRDPAFWTVVVGASGSVVFPPAIAAATIAMAALLVVVQRRSAGDR